MTWYSIKYIIKMYKEHKINITLKKFVNFSNSLSTYLSEFSKKLVKVKYVIDYSNKKQKSHLWGQGNLNVLYEGIIVI